MLKSSGVSIASMVREACRLVIEAGIKCWETDIPPMEKPSVKITEIYKSIQGESTWAGLPCVFVRLSGCPLRCRWCDTAYSFKDGATMTIDSIVAEVAAMGVPLVELTGGEPLAQPGARQLVRQLIDAGFKVLIETSGSESIADLAPEATVIMDLKCPNSGMSDRNLFTNIPLLKATDEVKFVVANKGDFAWATEKSYEFGLFDRCTVLVSPAFGLVKPDDLVSWIMESGAPFRLNMQIHKYIWHPRAKGV
jgi:7-carboxy-7-deazaguanine synthase